MVIRYIQRWNQESQVFSSNCCIVDHMFNKKEVVGVFIIKMAKCRKYYLFKK